MNYLSVFIEEIEAHTKEQFDFYNKRHRLYLSQKINRSIDEGKRIASDVQKVLHGNRTFDPSTHTIRKIPNQK